MGFLGCSLETAMAELGRGVDELELDLLESIPAGLRQQCAAKSDGALLAAWNSTLQTTSPIVTALL